MSKDKLVIFDTTLRDGEQSPGASMTLEEKVRIGKALERLRVDVIEAGFAIASPGDFESVKAVAAAVRESRICSLARARAEDIDRAAEALKPANAGRPPFGAFVRGAGVLSRHSRRKAAFMPVTHRPGCGFHPQA